MAAEVVTEKAPWQHNLVFAIAHEIGNHLGAIRLHADLIHRDQGTRALATTSVAIDDLAARAGPLLALLRPILSSHTMAGMESAEGLPWSVLFNGIQRQIEDEGTRGVRIEFPRVAESEQTAPGSDWLHPLLTVLVGSTLEVVSPSGTICFGLEFGDGQTVLTVEDDGAEEDLSSQAVLRGRPLGVEIARRLVAGLGGRVDVHRDSNRTRIELIFPNAA